MPNEVFASVPFLYILYPATPTESVDADHDKLTWDEDTVAVKFLGIDGAMVSPGVGGKTTPPGTVTEFDVALPDPLEFLAVTFHEKDFPASSEVMV